VSAADGRDPAENGGEDDAGDPGAGAPSADLNPEDRAALLVRRYGQELLRAGDDPHHAAALRRVFLERRGALPGLARPAVEHPAAPTQGPAPAQPRRARVLRAEEPDEDVPASADSSSFVSSAWFRWGLLISAYVVLRIVLRLYRD
jgi:hypothetical protein